ncbi:MAG: hypothetical protein ABSB42_00565 [Tepidisphaeraceae bacterium]|jgi:hypothetical protein
MPSNATILPPAAPLEGAPQATPTDAGEPDGAAIIDLLGRILSELIGLRLDLAADRETTADHPESPETDISEREFARRVTLLASNARSNPSTGNVNCALCGSPHKSGQSLRRHIRRYHDADVRRLPANSKSLAT